MKKNLYKYFFFMVCLVGGINVSGQVNRQTKQIQPKQKPQPVKLGIEAAYSAKINKIKIRWAPASEVSWRMGMKYGFILERRTILRDGNLLSQGEQIRSFRSYPCYKDSLQYWEQLIKINDNAAVMAQALFGEEFKVDINNSGSKKTGLGPNLLSKAEENKQRFLFGMYAADNDFFVAVKAGLGFIDTAIKNNEKYFYRIYSAGPKSVVSSDTALIFASGFDTEQLPASADIQAEPSSKSVVISWDMERNREFYNSFIVQRSEDNGKTFRSLTDRPYSSLGQGSNPQNPGVVVYVDTSVVEGLTYLYRVAGITIFGERGPWSATSTCKSLPLLEGVPGITGISLTNKGVAKLDWYFEDSIRKKVSGFDLQFSKSGNAPYFDIIKDIAADQSSILLPDTLQTGYLIIKANSNEGISRTSFPYLYQPEDSTAPHAPKGLKGSCDSKGRVVLKWLPNPEKDLLGYKVFRTMKKGAEYAVLVDTVWYKNEYYDTLDLKLRNSKIYYSVCALDFRHNHSDLAEGIEVQKPDIIPPTPAIFSNYEVNDGKILIEWVNSSDEDAERLFLFRKLHESDKWDTLLNTRDKNIRTYADVKILAEKKYDYRLAVVDSTGNKSEDAGILTVLAKPVNTNKIISSLEYQVDREKRMIYINWKKVEGAKVKQYEIFKGNEKEPMSLYKILDGTISDLIDSDLYINTKYKYAVRAVLETGQFSELVVKEINY